MINGKRPPFSTVEVLYNSENFLVVNKPYDVVLNWDDPSRTDTLQHLLQERFPDLVDESLTHHFRFVHRLDYSTSGPVCVALNKKAAGYAGKAFCQKQVVKHYLALVRGHIREDHLSINKAIGEQGTPDAPVPMCVEDTPGCQHPRDAVTQLTVVEKGLYEGQPATKVHLCPVSGRRHQLRVHCQSIGHPIVGDYTYSCRQDTTPYRMMLHAQKLLIPLKEEVIDIETDDPFVTTFDPQWQSSER
ncbi:RPUSD1 [Branchiostoma lanceolatum]|uniref:RPUSD1 protein n=1 Tax=Branchiostoma lanceolatum TaxID=7740 RepID=A0A8K0F389_BRALA|nr:RPUSD1 [Branchiostoma lanceolatum]